MKISCPTCAAKYSVADEKIQSRLAKIRCRKCSSTIVIDGMTTPASVYIGDPGAPGASASQDPGANDGLAARPSGAGFSNPAPVPSDPVGPAADEYAVDIADNDQRNMTIHQIVGAYNEGLISADTYIWKEGMADWQTLAEVKAVADALHAAAARPAPAAAVRRNDHGAAPDLFGRIATAGGEDDITTSAPQPTFSAGTGARNESSVLFSLSALTGGGEATAAPAGGGKRARTPADDSGLIDLTALTASEGSSSGGFGAAGSGFGGSGFGASPLISAPLGGVSGPAIGAGLMPNYGTQRSSGRTLIVAASLLAVAIIGGTALFVVNRSGPEPEPTSSLEAAAPAAGAPAAKAPAREPEAEPIAKQPEPVEKETETASVKDSVSPDELPTAAPEPAKAPVVRAPSPPKPKPAPAAAPVRAKPAPAPEPAAVAPAPKPAPVERSEPTPEPAPKKKAASRCECAPSDLMCAMRCSAKNR